MARVVAVVLTVAVILAGGGAGHAQSATYPNDPLFAQQWYLHNTGQDGGTPGADIHALEAWSITRCSPEITIAMIGTGVDGTHPDLASKLVPGISYMPGGSPTVDLGPHETMTAGIAAAATDNGSGIAGVCPLGTIMPIQVGTAQGLSYPFIESGIQWAIAHGARVLNLSFSSSASFADAIDAAYRANVVVVAAAPSADGFPANDPHVIAVDGTDNQDHAINAVMHHTPDLVLAPMKGVLTTVPGGEYGTFCTCQSIAAPQVAGIAALILSIRPDLTDDQVTHAIEQGADPVDGQTGYNETDGWGRVNAYRSLQIAQRFPPPTLKLTLKHATIGPGKKQVLTMRTATRATLTIGVGYGHNSPKLLFASAHDDGSYAYSWHVPHKAEQATVSVTAVSGAFGTRKTIHFIIRG